LKASAVTILPSKETALQARRRPGLAQQGQTMVGHYYHFHVRIACPPGDPYCQSQSPVSGGDGCGTELDDWFKKLRQAERQSPAIKTFIDVRLTKGRGRKLAHRIGNLGCGV
jgi:Penicillin-insensitive murein endopeptidase